MCRYTEGRWTRSGNRIATYFIAHLGTYLHMENKRLFTVCKSQCASTNGCNHAANAYVHKALLNSFVQLRLEDAHGADALLSLNSQQMGAACR